MVLGCMLAGTNRVAGPQFSGWLEEIMKTSLPGLDALSTSERLRLVQDLWDGIADEAESVPVREARKEELDRHLAD